MSRPLADGASKTNYPKEQQRGSEGGFPAPRRRVCTDLFLGKVGGGRRRQGAVARQCPAVLEAR